MKITDDNWQMLCVSIAEKQELFDYAASKGVPLIEGPIFYRQHGGKSYREDDELYLGYLKTIRKEHSGLVSGEYEDYMESITVPVFRRLCDEYATRKALAATPQQESHE